MDYKTFILSLAHGTDATTALPRALSKDSCTIVREECQLRPRGGPFRDSDRSEGETCMREITTDLATGRCACSCRRNSIEVRFTPAEC